MSADFFIVGSELGWWIGACVECQQESNFVAMDKWFLFSGLGVAVKLGVFDIETGCSEARGRMPPPGMAVPHRAIYGIIFSWAGAGR